MVLGSCPFPLCHISIYQVFFKCHKWFKSYLADNVPDRQANRRTKLRLHASTSGSIKVDVLIEVSGDTVSNNLTIYFLALNFILNSQLYCLRPLLVVHVLPFVFYIKFGIIIIYGILFITSV